MEFIISTGNGRTDIHWKEKTVTWDEFVKKLTRTTFTRETQEEFHRMKKSSRVISKMLAVLLLGN